MPCSYERRGMWDRRENVIVSLVVKWLGNMMNEVDIENLTIEHYLMLTQESQTQGMVRTEFGRMITKDIEDMTIAEYMEYEAEIKRNPWDYAKSYTRNLGSTNLEERKDPNDCQLSTPNSHHETEEVSSHEDVDEWLNAEISKCMIGKDKEEEEDTLIDILKTVVEEFIDTLEGPNETMLLGKPFLATIHAQIDVFRGEISLGIGNEKVKTLHYSEEIIDTVDSSDDSKEDEVGSHLSEDIVSRWHVCKPVHVTFKVCKEDCGIWPTCNLDLSFCSGHDAIYGKEKNGMLKYGNKNIDDKTHERRYYEWVAQNYDFNIKTTKYVDPYDSHHEKSHEYVPQNDNIPNDTLRINTYFPDVPQTQLKNPRLRDNLFKEWEKENFDFEEEFDDEIKQLENEYELKAGRKRYALEEVWEKCEKFHASTKLCESFEVRRYTFKNRKSFMSITKQMEDILTLGRVNGSRFIEKTRREMDEEGIATRKT
ncbi:hypothetical protein Tco_1456453 [Tanacetum coccineum]